MPPEHRVNFGKPELGLGIINYLCNKYHKPGKISLPKRKYGGILISNPNAG
jgi:hypothetical protein